MLYIFVVKYPFQIETFSIEYSDSNLNSPVFNSENQTLTKIDILTSHSLTKLRELFFEIAQSCPIQQFTIFKRKFRFEVLYGTIYLYIKPI